MRRGRAALALAVALGLARPRAVAAEPTGSVAVGSELLITGGVPRQRARLAVTGYLGRRAGVRVAVQQVQLSPLAEAGAVTVGVAYRAAAARPKLELVVHAEAGVTWPLAPAAGGGLTTFLWPTRLPLALTFDLGALAVVDGVEDSRLGLSVGLGLALAR